MGKRLLVVVDVQSGFVYGDGDFPPVPDAEAIFGPIQDLLNSGDYDGVVFTMDTHLPQAYGKSQEAELFPIHCVPGTAGWDLVGLAPRLTDFKKLALQFARLDCPETVATITRDEKGFEAVLPKSKFDVWAGNHKTEEFLRSQLEDGDWEVDVVGLATDYCVAMAAQGFVSRGYDVRILPDCVRGISKPYKQVCSELGIAPLDIRSGVSK